MKFVLGALAAVTMLVGVSVTSQPAAAAERCIWNGWTWHCRFVHPHGWWWRAHQPFAYRWHPYAYRW